MKQVMTHKQPPRSPTSTTTHQPKKIQQKPSRFTSIQTAAEQLWTMDPSVAGTISTSAQGRRY